MATKIFTSDVYNKRKSLISWIDTVNLAKTNWGGDSGHAGLFTRYNPDRVFGYEVFYTADGKKPYQQAAIRDMFEMSGSSLTSFMGRKFERELATWIVSRQKPLLLSSEIEGVLIGQHQDRAAAAKVAQESIRQFYDLVSDYALERAALRAKRLMGGTYRAGYEWEPKWIDTWECGTEKTFGAVTAKKTGGSIELSAETEWGIVKADSGQGRDVRIAAERLVTKLAEIANPSLCADHPERFCQPETSIGRLEFWIDGKMAPFRAARNVDWSSVASLVKRAHNDANLEYRGNYTATVMFHWGNRMTWVMPEFGAARNIVQPAPHGTYN